ncbi:MAG: O-antigen ligase family protein [Patescibacteria group bacterium]|nr:O-antigen ligase family protein [Patescibacteria group bacterium]
MKNTKIFLLILILIIFPFGQLLRFHLPSLPVEIKFQPLELLVFIYCGLWVFAKAKRDCFVRYNTGLAMTVKTLFFPEMLVFFLLAAASLLIKIPTLPLNEFIPAFFYLLRLGNFFVFYLALRDFLQEGKKPWQECLIFVGLGVALLALGQYLFLPDTRFLLKLGWDEHYYRAIGSFLDPAFTGLLLVLAFLTLFFKFLRHETRPWWLWLSGLLMIIALVLTFSRTAYLALFCGLAILLAKGKNLKIYLLILLCFLSLIWLAPKPGGEGVNLKRISSFLAKTENYKEVITVIKDHFWLGVGFNTYRYTQRDLSFVTPIKWQSWETSNAAAGADNSFLFVFATTGIFGFLSFLFLWGKILMISFQKKDKGNGLLLFASAAAVLLSANFSNFLFYPWIIFWLDVLLAVFTAES